MTVRVKAGPSTYFVRSPVAGGQLVQAHPVSKKVEPAEADSVLVLGAALYDAAPLGTAGPLDFSGVQEELAVAFTGEVLLRACGVPEVGLSS